MRHVGLSASAKLLVLNGKIICGINEGLRERTEYIDIFLFPPITQLCSVSDVCLLVEGECQILVF